MRRCFVSHNPNQSSAELIDTANAIILEYQQQGFQLTLRQLYYQFVARDILPNQQRSYDRLGEICSRARMGGLMDWEALEDRSRNLLKATHWRDPAEIISAAANTYRIETRSTQKTYIEVWVEKDALSGVVNDEADRWDVPCFPCRGYVSVSAMYEAAQRIAAKMYRPEFSYEDALIIHLGDHDPSGIDMTRDITERLRVMTGGIVRVLRIALNMNQVEEYNPPPNPAKVSDSRAADYIANYGSISWELDALDPPVIQQLIGKTIQNYTDKTKWKKRNRQQQQEMEKLQEISTRYANGELEF